MKTWYPEKKNFTGRKCYELYQGAHEPCRSCPSLRAFTSKTTERAEVSGRFDSPVEWIGLFAYPMLDRKTGNITGIVELVRDIMERKQIEKNLQENEEKHRSLFEQAVAAVYIHDAEGNFIDVNQAACKQTGYSKKELLQLNVFEIHPTNKGSINMPKDEALALWQQAKVGARYAFEFEHKRKDGTIFPVRVSTGLIRYGNRNLFMVFVEDITDRKQIEQLLIDTKDFYENIIEKVNDGIWVTDKNDVIIYTNPAMAQIAGISTTEIVGKMS